MKKHDEVVLCATKERMAVCIYLENKIVSQVIGKEFHPNKEGVFCSVENKGYILNNVTYFARIRNPNETLQ